MGTELQTETLIVEEAQDLPPWGQRDELVRFFHETMKPWNDSPEDVGAALDYVFSDAEGKGGFLTLMQHEGSLVGAVAMLETGMSGYVPDHILLFVSVDPSMRGQGLGADLIQRALAHCRGDVKLHVEYENPAKKLYERLGFTTKYAEMRYKNPNA